jgi:hypothetical protein
MNGRTNWRFLHDHTDINDFARPWRKERRFLKLHAFSFPHSTLCHHEGLSPYGACRLCVVEIGDGPGRDSSILYLPQRKD